MNRRVVASRSPARSPCALAVRVAIAVLGLFATRPASLPLAAQAQRGGETLVQTIPGTDVTFELTWIPGGAFRLGSPEAEVGRDADEGPQRLVSLGAFWIGVTEVTHDVFSRFRDRRLDSVEGRAPGIPFDADAVARPSPPYEDPSHGMSGPGRPATGMTRLSALRFARWLSEKTGRLYRLPTEAEWEYACRAGGAGPWGLGAEGSGPFGDSSAEDFLERHAWYAANSGGSFHDVGTKSPNAWGVHDLLGNVAEWTLDPYDAAFYASIAADGSATNPSTGPSARGRGVVRGGAFDDDGRSVRCADRFEETPAWKRRDPQIPKSAWWNTDSPHVGFRLVSPAGDHTVEEIRAYWDSMLGSE